jgi:curli production assembly/transport component CsgE
MVLFASVILSAFLINPINVSGDSLKNKQVPVELMKIVEQATKHSINSDNVEIEIDGLLVDDTKTKAGKDFYDLFCNTWEAPFQAKSYSITVSEKPFRLSSTLITVSINDILVYQAILQPRQDILEAMTGEAIAITQEYLVNYEEIMKQINGDDLSGSGIY